MRKLLLTLGILILSLVSQAQPITLNPFTLTSGNYVFQRWDASSPANTFPPNMQFVRFRKEMKDSLGASEGPWTCAYNLTTRSRFIGLGTNGIGFQQTSNTSDMSNCTQPNTVSDSTRRGFCGAAVLSLNTTGATNINVNWTGTLSVDGDGNGGSMTPRAYNIQLQWRIGNNGNWAVVPGGGTLRSARAAVGAAQSFSTVLPTILENLPEVQLRWMYYDASVTSAGGTRPQMDINNITVSIGAPTSVSAAVSQPNVQVYPNPSQGKVIINGLTAGAMARFINTLGQVQKTISHDGDVQLPIGVYTVQTLSVGHNSTQRLVVE